MYDPVELDELGAKLVDADPAGDPDGELLAGLVAVAGLVSRLELVQARVLAELRRPGHL